MMADPRGIENNRIKLIDLIVESVVIMERQRPLGYEDDTLRIFAPEGSELYNRHPLCDWNQQKLEATSNIQVLDLDVRPLHDTSSSQLGKML